MTNVAVVQFVASVTWYWPTGRPEGNPWCRVYACTVTSVCPQTIHNNDADDDHGRCENNRSLTIFVAYASRF